MKSWIFVPICCCAVSFAALYLVYAHESAGSESSATETSTPLATAAPELPVAVSKALESAPMSSTPTPSRPMPSLSSSSEEAHEVADVAAVEASTVQTMTVEQAMQQKLVEPWKKATGRRARFSRAMVVPARPPQITYQTSTDRQAPIPVAGIRGDLSFDRLRVNAFPFVLTADASLFVYDGAWMPGAEWIALRAPTVVSLGNGETMIRMLPGETLDADGRVIRANPRRNEKILDNSATQNSFVIPQGE